MNVLITIGLLLGNAFFVGSEFALIASRRTIVEPLAGSLKRARWALSGMKQIPLMIAGAQLGITICSLGLGAIAEPALAHLFERPFAMLHLPAPVLHPAAFLAALGVVIFLHTVVGEMVPKNIAIAGPERSVLWLGGPMLAFCTATKPLLLVLKWVARVFLKLWRIEATDAVKTVYTAKELAGLVAESRTVGLLDAEEHARITGALALQQRTAADALRPWQHVYTIGPDVTPASLEALATSTGRSRFPLADQETRKVLGFVHVKDVLPYSGDDRHRSIPTSVIRPLRTVPMDRSLADLLLFMRRESAHIALVTDGTRPLGVVTLDDVLTAVMGSRLKPVEAAD